MRSEVYFVYISGAISARCRKFTPQKKGKKKPAPIGRQKKDRDEYIKKILACNHFLITDRIIKSNY